VGKKNLLKKHSGQNIVRLLESQNTKDKKSNPHFFLYLELNDIKNT
jgi:hypothetical protein